MATSTLRERVSRRSLEVCDVCIREEDKTTFPRTMMHRLERLAVDD